MDVLYGLFAAEGKVALDLVARLQQGPFVQRLQRVFLPVVNAFEIGA
ncbi:MAG: hypothetical protein P8Y80_11645 [Acidobacteriota bacterium]